MKKTLPYYMMLALYEQFDMVGLQSEVEVGYSGAGLAIFTTSISTGYAIRNVVRFQRMLGEIPDALRNWAEKDPDIKRILVEVEL